MLNLKDHLVESQHGIDNHYFDLITLLVERYYVTRLRHIARIHSMSFKNSSVRQKLTKSILFKGN